MRKPWQDKIRLDDVPQKGLFHKFAPDEQARRQIARTLDLAGLPSLDARLSIKPWLDGIEICGEWDAEVTQACIVTLEPLSNALTGDFVVRVVPAGSIHAPDESALSDVDPEADDPPDVSADGEIDLAGYVIEHLSLEIDPYPRKPGAEFQPPSGGPETSPFAVLKILRKD